MASLGSFLLLATFVVCAYAAVMSVVGARRRSRRLIESGIGAFYLVCALMTAASAVIVNAFLTGDYSIKYVQHYSDSVQPLFYKHHVVLGRPRRLDHVLGVPAVDFRLARRVREPRAPSRADPLRRRHHLQRADVLPVPDGGAQESVHDVSRRSRRPTARV